MTAPRAIAAEQAAPAIVCHCGQHVAERYGPVIKPIGARMWRERNGKLRIECPRCKARLTVEREAR